MTSGSIQGFKILPLAFSTNSTSCHDLLIKEHSVRAKDDLKPPGQTLFALNIPPYATETGLKNAFSNVGNIKRIIFEHNTEDKNSDDGFKRAFIVFNNREQLLKALKLQKLNPLSSDVRPVKVGLEKWIEEYNKSICDPEELQQEINMFMAEYDEEKRNKNEEVVDDEGWTVVTKAGRRPGLSRKESLANKLNDKVQKATKKKELKNFYTFQIRESKMKNIADLRKNFEEAKKKVQIMKQARKFKPF